MDYLLTPKRGNKNLDFSNTPTVERPRMPKRSRQDSSAMGGRFRKWGATFAARQRARMANSASRTMRLLGLSTSQIHSFRRTGNQIMITNAAVGGLPNVNGAPAGTEAIGLQLANFLPGLVGGTMQYGGAFNFKMSNVSRFGEIVSLFDNYRIQKVVLRFDYVWSQAPVQSAIANSTALPVLHIAEDTDDHVPPLNQTAVVENSKCRTYRLDQTCQITISPKVSTAVLSTGGTTVVGGTPQGSMWLDNTAVDVIHDGCKFWISHYPDVNPGTCGITITPIYYLEAKNVS